ncbi:hypothetical protein RI103_33390 [Paraburkholderia sp. FT54]|uniref:hypothetical protein n=1 Tax=Paraburkholderia sp. FT54 TaxID=3074437 RepID=UPI002877D8FE|nr:hypothetical protein [Paraburkholderia sp. FT54]WNC94827.1 hypothetical protein RI103_33390 [Paraburkholderia sp. FT54]
MRQTVLGVFDSYDEARSAQQTLSEAGVAQADIALYTMSNSAPVESGPRIYSPGGGDPHRNKPVFDQLEQLFARLFKIGEYPPETEDYREFIRRGGTIVSADVSEMQADLARDLMRRAGAADIRERAEGWRAGSRETRISEHALNLGGSTDDDYSKQYEPSTGQQFDTSSRHVPLTDAAYPTEDRAVARDASSVPAASRTFTNDDSAAEARVMHGTAFSSGRPEMVGGMQQVTTRTEGLGSRVPVDELPTQPGAPVTVLSGAPHDADAALKTAAPYTPDGSTSGANTRPTSEKGLTENPAIAAPPDDAYGDNEFREDYDTNYANTGASYDEYRRAYTHGATLGQDERHRGRDWQAVESSARENWESRYPESGWERFKAAVRHGWDRVTGG